MDNAVQISVVLTCIQILSGTTALYCYNCPASVGPFVCSSGSYCLSITGCFSQSWFDLGIKKYQYGCLKADQLCSSIRGFCTDTNALRCCEGDVCNYADPLQGWVPKTPRSLMYVVGTNSVYLAWDSECADHYRYRIRYTLHADPSPEYWLEVSTNQVRIDSLLSGSTYTIGVRSLYNGLRSEEEMAVINTYATSTTTYAAPTRSHPYCWRTENSANAPSDLQRCPNVDDMCYSKTEYLASWLFTVTSRGCQPRTSCEDLRNQNVNNCQPGIVGRSCHFCCEEANCNTFGWTYSQLTCNDIPVSERRLCGWSGIDAGSCAQQGCCYSPRNDTSVSCHYGRYPGDGSSTMPPTGEISSAGVDVWVIIVIVVVILIVIIIVIFVVCCCIRRKRRLAKGSYDVYSVPNRDREPRIRTVAREAYDNTVSEA